VLRTLDEATFLAVFEGVPTFGIAKEKLPMKAADLLAVETQVFSSKGEFRKLVQGGGLSVNKEKFASAEAEIAADSLLNGKYLLVQKGKKNYFIVRAE